MAKLLALYRKPADAGAFDAYYFERHVPIAKRIPGLRAYQVSRGPIAAPQGQAIYHLVSTLEFESLAALQQALASPEGNAAGADLANFAEAGVELYVFETREL